MTTKGKNTSHKNSVMAGFSQIKMFLNVVNIAVTLLISAAGFQLAFFSAADARSTILGLYVL
jgi:hypothetical protein